MDFFEVLRERVNATWSGGKALYMSNDWRFGRKAGIKATIEALREMKVGEPTGGKIQQTRWVGGGTTYIRSNDDGFAMIDFDGFCGTDDEEVVVMVFKKP